MAKIIKNVVTPQKLSDAKIEKIAHVILPSKAASAYLSGDTDDQVISELRQKLAEQGIDSELYHNEDSLHNLMLQLASKYLAKI